MPARPVDIVGFWRQAGPTKWFARDGKFDDAIRLRFEPTHFAAARGEYRAWEADAEGALALLLLLDQFPRNLFRGSAHAYATDPLARRIATEAIERGFDRQVEPQLRPFFYLPFEHSEALADQKRSIALCQRLADETGDAGTLKWAQLHLEIIEKHGRFPHRNAALGRTTTAEEKAFLDGGGFSG